MQVASFLLLVGDLWFCHVAFLKKTRSHQLPTLTLCSLTPVLPNCSLDSKPGALSSIWLPSLASRSRLQDPNFRRPGLVWGGREVTLSKRNPEDPFAKELPCRFPGVQNSDWHPF